MTLPLFDSAPAFDREGFAGGEDYTPACPLRGDSFTAALNVNTNGNRQSVTITPQATYIINVQIGMGKAAATAAR